MAFLRSRLLQEFGIDLKGDDVTRWEVMSQLLECYKSRGPRTIRKVSGRSPRDTQVLDLLLQELRNVSWPANEQRERPKIRAQGYIILSRPTPTGSGSKAEKLAVAKVQRHQRLWELASQAMAEVDEEYAKRWTAIAITHNFSGSAHIDHDNVGPFYGLALGDFQGGGICVESSPFEVCEVDTRGRFGKVDGRYPHWVAPYTGERYSVIYYATWGDVVPQGPAVFEGSPQS